MKLPNTYTSLLSKFISFKSISTDPAHAQDCTDAAMWLQKTFTAQGFTAELLPLKRSNPLVHAYYEVSKDAPTVLIYGHYDVQPAQKEGWHADPFTVHEKAGRLYARGVMDNKGQVLIHIASVFDLIKEGTLTYNVRFLIEGDEESGSPDVAGAIATHKKKLACDYILVSDGILCADERPGYEKSYRMAANMRVHITTANNDLHSGLYGGAVPNAAQVLSRILGTLVDDKTHTVTAPGFYAGVTTPDSATLRDARKAHSNSAAQEEAGVKKLLLQKGQSFGTQTGFFPSLEISGIASGYTGPGFQNIVPHAADARINVRVAPGQKTAQVMQALARHIKKQTPSYATLTIETEEYGDPILVDTDNDYSQRAREVAHDVYGKAPVPLYCGATIPIVGLFQDILKKPVVSIGLSNADSNIHGVNENFTKAAIAKGYAFSRALLGSQ